MTSECCPKPRRIPRVRGISHWGLAVGVSAVLLALGPGEAAPADLKSPVTLTGKRILLGELLEELSRQSGHTLRLGDDRDAVSGIELAVNLTGQPLGEVMSSLEALFSSRFNQWEFQKAGERVYLLRRQRTIAAAVAAARAEIGRRWAADLDSCIAHAKQPDLTREQWAKPRPDLFPGGVVDHGRMDLLSALKPLEVEALKRGAFVPLDPAKLGKRAAGAMSL